MSFLPKKTHKFYTKWCYIIHRSRNMNFVKKSILYILIFTIYILCPKLGWNSNLKVKKKPQFHLRVEIRYKLSIKITRDERSIYAQLLNVINGFRIRTGKISSPTWRKHIIVRSRQRTCTTVIEVVNDFTVTELTFLISLQILAKSIKTFFGKLNNISRRLLIKINVILM